MIGGPRGNPLSPHYEHRERDATEAMVRAAQIEGAFAYLRETLKGHYLTGVECNPVNHMDRASCSCSRVDLGWQPSIGEAVDSWIAHFLEVGGFPKAEQPNQRRNS